MNKPSRKSIIQFKKSAEIEIKYLRRRIEDQKKVIALAEKMLLKKREQK